MKALTICQPYAQLIVRGEKRVENREWPTRYRGPLAIHAGVSREWLQPEDLVAFELLHDPLVFGAVVGVANLVACLHIEAITLAKVEKRFPWIRDHEHTNGTWCWVLEDVRRFDPIPWKGAQRLWTLPEGIVPAAGARP